MSVTIKGPDLDELKRLLPSEKLAKIVMWRALNRGVIAGKTAASREAAKNYAVRQRQVSEKAKIIKPTQGNLEGVISFSGPALNIVDFRVSPKQPQPAKRPVLRVTISKNGGQKPYKGAFLIPIRSGTVKAFRRDGKDRLPISPVYGPSIATLVGGERVRDAVQDRMIEVVVTRLDHEINRELGKGR